MIDKSYYFIISLNWPKNRISPLESPSVQLTKAISNEKLGLYVELIARPGQESALAEFLKSGLALANAETGTISWYAFQTGKNKFGIFDTFKDAEGREAHLNGDIAKALFAQADTLLAEDPKIIETEILAAK